MIKVTIIRNDRAQIVQYNIEGHAGYAESGEDIVCAGVSAISGAAIVGMERMLGITLDIIVKKDNLICTIPEHISEQHRHDVNIILETMALGLKDISDKYKKFVKVLDKEV